MATVTTTLLAESVQSRLKDLSLYRSLNPSRPHGLYLLSWAKTLTATEKADFDASGDFLEIVKFGPDTHLVAASVTVPDMDTNGAPAITLDLMADATVLVNDNTSGQAGGTFGYTATGLTDVSSTTLKLKIETVAATVPSSYPAGFSAKLLVYYGTVASLS